MLAYQGEAEAAGAMIVLRTPILSGIAGADGFDLSVGGDEPGTIRCRFLVNAAGLHAPALAAAIAGVPAAVDPNRLFLPRRVLHSQWALAV